MKVSDLKFGSFSCPLTRCRCNCCAYKYPVAVVTLENYSTLAVAKRPADYVLVWRYGDEYDARTYVFSEAQADAALEVMCSMPPHDDDYSSDDDEDEEFRKECSDFQERKTLEKLVEAVNKEPSK